MITKDEINYDVELAENTSIAYAAKVIGSTFICISVGCGIRLGSETAAEDVAAGELVVSHDLRVAAYIAGIAAAMNILESKAGESVGPCHAA